MREGDDLARPVEQVRAERDRIVSEYSELLATDEDRKAFEEKIGLARVVFPYVENHNFYVEHWAHSMVWRKMRELGRVFVKEGFIADENDVFYWRRNEIPDVIWDLYQGWAVGAPARGPKYWAKELPRRKAILAALAEWSPPPALGKPPEVVTEPFTIMLWGITNESINQWLSAGEAGDSGELRGMAASPGVVEGPARVIFSPSQVSEIQDGEILVAPLTAPELGTDLRQDRRDGHRRRRDDVARRDRVPGVRAAGRGRHRVRHQADQDRPADPGRRQHRHGQRPGGLTRHTCSAMSARPRRDRQPQ